MAKKKVLSETPEETAAMAAAAANQGTSMEATPITPPRGPDASPAAATLHPQAAGSDNDPRTKFEWMQKILGQFAAMGDGWDKWAQGAVQDMAALSHAGGGVPDGAAAHNASTIVAHGVKEDLDKALEGVEGLSEEFRSKASTLFEAAVEARMILERQQLDEQVKKLQEEYDAKLLTEVEHITECMTEATQEYLDYAGQEWMKENEVAIESALRVEIAEDLLEGLKNLLISNNFQIPEEQVDVVSTMSEKIDELEGRLATSISEIADLKKALEESAKKDIVAKVTEGLTVVETEKLKELAENLDYETVDEFKSKLETIKGSQFVKEPKKSLLAEDLEEPDTSNEPKEEKYVDPEMKGLVDFISRQVARKTGNFKN